VNETRREIRTYQGEPAFTQFSSSSGGWASAGSMPYLPAQPDPYDGWSGNPNHSWATKVTDTRVENAFPQIGNLRRIAVIDRDGNGQWGGRVVSIRFVGADASVAVSGATFRSKFGLKSEWVTFAVRRR
jgi:peptidoglycan hydrolase-like amidase